MNLYHCETCGQVMDENDIIKGETISEDEYYNDMCDYCGSENIYEIDYEDICPICGEFMENEDESGRYCACRKKINVAELHPIFADLIKIITK